MNWVLINVNGPLFLYYSTIPLIVNLHQRYPLIGVISLNLGHQNH